MAATVKTKQNAKHKLVIVESPAKAKTIAKYLGKNYKVIASQGHVRDLPKSMLGIDPDRDFEMKYITIRGRGDILAAIRKEAKDASSVYLATDPDREGEAISWHLAAILGISPASVCRIEFNEVTKKAVQAAIKNPRALDMNRIDAQQARRALDRLVGYKISPLLWSKVKKGLSAGRVQSVATRMVVAREDEIDSFEPEEYWDISAVAVAGKNVKCNVRLSLMDGQKAVIRNAAEAENAVKIITEDSFTVSSVRKGEKKKTPAAPFTTSSLQQEAGRKLNFTTAKTMQVVQQLYEGVELAGEGSQGLVTYIRTDSVRISQDALDAVRAFIPQQYGPEYLPEKPNEYRGRKNAQDAHEAIRPTDVTRRPEAVKASLTRDQYQLYKLIFNRFVASQMVPAAYVTLTADITGKHAGLHFYGEHKKFAGFTALYEESRDDVTDAVETTLPNLDEGMPVTVTSVKSEQHFTQPPARYTEASLVRAMEEKGIGRPSTYAPTITTVIGRGYVSREKKRLYPTELGRTVTSMMENWFDDIVDMDFTAAMENKLDAVEEGEIDWKEILRDFYPPFVKRLEVAEKEIEKVEVQDVESDVTCELCGAPMVYRMGRYGQFLACRNFPNCRNTKPIVKYVEQVTCPECGGRIVEKLSKKNRRFYGCENYPACSFVSWDQPVSERCSKCGSPMVLKHTSNGAVRVCINETCRHREAVQQAEDEQE